MSMEKSGNPIPKCPRCSSVSSRKGLSQYASGIENRVCNACGKSFDVKIQQNHCCSSCDSCNCNRDNDDSSSLFATAIAVDIVDDIFSSNSSNDDFSSNNNDSFGGGSGGGGGSDRDW